MANPHRGEVPLHAGDRVWTLCLSINALCEAEDHFGKPFTQIVSEFETPESMSLKTLRGVVWAALQDHHPGVSLRDAGNVINDAGMQEALDAMGRAFAAAFPDAEANADPQTAAA